MRRKISGALRNTSFIIHCYTLKIKQISEKLNAGGFDVDQNIARVSIIGAGMKSESGVASKMFKILGDSEINISMISTSPIRVSCVINSKDTDQALNVLHEEFIIKK